MTAFKVGEQWEESGLALHGSIRCFGLSFSAGWEGKTGLQEEVITSNASQMEEAASSDDVGTNAETTWKATA